MVYTIAVTNFGPDTATGVVVIDQIPAVLSYVSHVASQGGYVPASGLWTIGTMTPMQVQTLTLKAYLPVGISGTSITNTVTVTAVDQMDTNTINDTASVVVAPEKPPLDIDKQSDVATTIAPGGIITYTITVTNQSSQTQTGVTVSDTLPSGVTLVPGSVSVFGPTVTNLVVRDTFAVQSFANNNGNINWEGNWIESEGDGPSSGGTRVWTDSGRGPYTIRFGGTSKTLAREINLSGYTNATLSLLYRRDGLLEAADLVQLQASSNGVAGTWTTIATYAGPATDGSYSTTSINLASYISTNTAIRFSSPGDNTPGNIVWFDDVSIFVPATVYTNRPGGGPPTVASGYTLSPGDYLRITLAAEVDYLPSILQLTNSASVISVQMSKPRTDTVVDEVLIDYAALGGIAWFDGDGDGVQDGGETNRIVNVPVTLLKIEGGVTNVLRTSTTAVDGSYAFTNLMPGVYAVRWDLTTVTGSNIRVTSALQGTNATVDSDGEFLTEAPYGTGGLVSTRSISLDYGDHKDDIDLGVAYLLSTRAELSSLWGEWRGGGGYVVWRTSSEWNTAGFFLYAVHPETGVETRLNEQLVVSAFNAAGAQYELVDPQAAYATNRTYRLEEVELTGQARDLGTYTATFKIPEKTFLKQVEAGFAVQAAAVEDNAVLSGSAERLTVRFRKSGVYGIAFEAIAAGMGLALVDVAALAQTNGFVLSRHGQNSVSYLVDAESARLLFYGVATDNWYIRDAAYQIEVGDGMSMMRRDPQAAGGRSVFPVVVDFQEDVYPRDSAPVRPDDYFYWKYVISGNATLGTQPFVLDLTGYAGGSLSLRVALIGGSSTARNPDHKAIFTLNNVVVGEATFDDRNSVEVDITVPAAVVVDGVNTLKVTGSLLPGQTHSFFYVDWIRASFDRSLRPDAGTVHLQSDDALYAQGYEHPLALAVTDPSQPLWIADAEGVLEPAAWRAEGGAEAFVVVDAQRIPMLVPEPSVAGSWLTDTNNRIDYLVITSRALEASAHVLAAYRRNQGLRVGVTTYEEISDVFGRGLRTPESIQWMLSYAYGNWAAAPWMVLLAGNGHYDYPNTLGFGNNHIPPLLHATPDGLFAADSLFGDLTKDGLPDISIGRLPARTLTELDAMIAKIMAFEQDWGASWQRDVVLAAGKGDAAGAFAADSERLALHIPEEYVLARLYVDEIPVASARSALLSHMKVGVGIVHYTGHGGSDNIGGILRATDAQTLTNTKAPVLVALSCLAARFEAPGVNSLGSQLMRRGGGGTVAVMGPSGLSAHESAMALGEAFQSLLNEEQVGLIGVAYLWARHAVAGGVMGERTRGMYNLMSDPALRVGGLRGGAEEALRFAQWRRERYGYAERERPKEPSVFRFR